MLEIFKKYIKQITIGFLAGLVSRFFFNRWRTYTSASIYVFIKYRLTKSKRNISILYITHGTNKQFLLLQRKFYRMESSFSLWDRWSNWRIYRSKTSKKATREGFKNSIYNISNLCVTKNDT